MELDVLAHQRDGAGLAAGGDAAHHLLPLGQVGGGHVQLELFHHHVVQTIGVQHQRALVQAGHGQVLDDALRLDVAEGADLAEDGGCQRLVGAQDDDIRFDAHALQFLDRVLGGLGLMLVGATEERHQRHVDEQAVLLPYLQRDLAHRLQEGLGLDIADGAADFGDDHIRVGRRPTL